MWFFFSLFYLDLGVNLTEVDVGSSQHIETSSSSHHNHNHTAAKKLHETVPNDVDLTDGEQLVKPSKIHVQPLHADDLLYESTKYEPGAGEAFFYFNHRPADRPTDGQSGRDFYYANHGINTKDEHF